MARSFHLTIASVEENLFDGEVVSVSLPGTEGALTVLAGHEALVTTLRPGTIRIMTATAQPLEYAVSAGVLEVSGNQATVIL